MKYENTILKTVDVDTIPERLDELMEEEKIYMDYDLTLNRLSEMLMVTPHQLSRILNSHRKINFRKLVNTYRVKESMNMMKDYPDRNILEIALASGFNSKSSFNSVFAKEIGVTPRDYRKSLKN